MPKTRKIKKPDKRAREAGEELVRLASWGMVSRIESGAELDRLKFTFGMVAYIIFGTGMILVVAFLIPYSAQLSWLAGPIIALVGLALSFWGITRGMESVLDEERSRRKVVMYPSSYKFEEEDILVTAVNIGDPLIVRGIDLYVGWVEANRELYALMGKGLAIFRTLGYVPLRMECMPFNTGSILRIPEDEVKKALLHIASWFKENLEDYKEVWTETSPSVYLIMYDRFLEYHTANQKETRPGTITTKPMLGAVSMCNLGDFNLLLTEAQSEEGLKIHQMSMEIKGDSKGQWQPARMAFTTPPIYPSEQEYMAKYLQTLEEILEKLDTIQKGQGQNKGRSETKSAHSKT
jgi:hypothetical protein